MRYPLVKQIFCHLLSVRQNCSGIHWASLWQTLGSRVGTSQCTKGTLREMREHGFVFAPCFPQHASVCGKTIRVHWTNRTVIRGGCIKGKREITIESYWHQELAEILERLELGLMTSHNTCLWLAGFIMVRACTFLSMTSCRSIWRFPRASEIKTLTWISRRGPSMKS